MKRLLLLAGALAATLALGAPVNAAPPTGSPSGSGGGSAPGQAQVGIQATSVGTDVNPINGFWNQGWWSDNVTNDNDNTNHVAGTFFAGGDRWRNYFTFDMTAFNAHPCTTPQTATLRASAGVGSFAFAGIGPVFVTYRLYGVTTDPFVLSQKVNNPDAAIFNDLGSGPIYGSYTLPTFTDGGVFTLNLNQTALNAIATAKANGEQYFSLGGSLVPQPADTAWVMGFTHIAPYSFPARLTVNWPFVCRIR
jgi:hypothetical protein